MKDQPEKQISCANCVKCEVQQLPPPNLGKAMICRALPPIPMVMPGRGGQAAMMSMFPVVTPETWCYQFEERPAATEAPLLQS